MIIRVWVPTNVSFLIDDTYLGRESKNQAPETFMQIICKIVHVHFIPGDSWMSKKYPVFYNIPCQVEPSDLLGICSLQAQQSPEIERGTKR